MKLRDGNIIVCECGVEKNPEITLDVDFIKHVDNVATCSKCLASDLISFPASPGVIVEPSIVEVVDELITALVDKGVLY